VTALLAEFGALLYLLVSLYLVYRFGTMLYKYGRHWMLTTFCTSVMLIVASIAVQRGWAAFARHLATEGDFNIFMDEWRWPVNFGTAVIFTIGAYMFESELMEVKRHGERLMVYFALIAIAGTLTIL